MCRLLDLHLDWYSMRHTSNSFAEGVSLKSEFSLHEKSESFGHYYQYMNSSRSMAPTPVVSPRTAHHT